MKRYEIWIDNDGRLVVSEFRYIDSDNEMDIYKGRETYAILKKLASKKMVDIYINPNDEEITLEYKNYIININDMEKVFEKRGMGPIINNIRLFEEEKALKKTKKKKVTRKNKHTGTKIIATALTLVVLASIVYTVKNNASAISSDELDSGYEISSTEQYVSEVRNLSVEDEETNEDETLYDDVKMISIDYNDRSDTNKAYKTKAYYGNLIEKYSTRYGLDSELVTAIATQERGVHGTTIDDGGAIGLMQIQYNVWVGEKISAYNFETGQRESFIVDKEKLPDIGYNIKVGCMYLQNCMESMNYNTVAAVQAYNMGCGSVNKILKAYSSECGKSVNEILSNPSDTGWLEYRNIINMGDPNYVENVFSYLGEDSYINNVKRDGTIVNLNINNQVSSKKIY